MAIALVLASQSPQRIDLVARLGLAVIVQPSAVDEAAVALPSDPAERVRTLAQAKAEAVALRHSRRLVLGADTLVALDGNILGKPDSPGAAAAMLRRLSGRSHTVHSGLALVVPGRFAIATDSHPAVLTAVVSSIVTFHPLDDEQIAAYVGTGEPLDKAGAYGIQGHGRRLVAALSGCFTNVVGLPLCAVAALLTAATGQEVACPADAACRIGDECRCLCRAT